MQLCGPNPQKFFFPRKKSSPLFTLHIYHDIQEADMKTRIALFALAVGALAIIGCAGTPAAVDRFGNVQPDIQAYKPPTNMSDIETETRPLFMPGNRSGSFGAFGFNYLQTWQTPVTFALPYNRDASLTVFKTDNFQIKLMPAQKADF